MKDIIEKSKFIYHYSRFVKIEEIGGLLSTLDMYLTFSYRDACPNAVIEAMSYGLPIVGFDSGGIKDIVKNAGEVMSFNDTFDHFGPGRFNNNFPDIDKENVLTTGKRVKKNIIHYKKLVEKRFDDDLDMNLIAKKYYQCIDSLGSS